MLTPTNCAYVTPGGVTIEVVQVPKGWKVDTGRRDILKESHGWLHYTTFVHRSSAIRAAELLGEHMDGIAPLLSEVNSRRNKATKELNALVDAHQTIR